MVSVLGNERVHSSRRALRGPEYEWERQYLSSFSKVVSEDSVVCNPCRMKLSCKDMAIMNVSDR